MPDPQSRVPSPRAYALAARRAAKRTPGVAGMGGCVCAWTTGGVPGVTLRVEVRERMFVEVEIVAQPNQRLEALGRAIQTEIASEFEKLPGLRAVAIDVLFTGIRYDKRALPKPKEYSK